MAKNEGYSVKREIMDAVMQLMGMKNYMDITVTDIVNTAGVARASFYRNFTSISDVIDSITSEVSEEMIEEVFPILSSTDERAWREFLFHHFYHFSKVKKSLNDVGSSNMSVIFTRMSEKIQDKESELSPETLRDKYQTIGKWGLINSILQKWIDTGCKETPEEIIDYIMSFITLF